MIDTIRPVLEWLAASPLGRFMNGAPWAFPAAEVLHFMGLSLLLGALIVVDLRLLGIGQRVPMRATHALLPLAVLGFAVNLVTGVAFLASDPLRYLANPAFIAKMALVGLAGLNLLWFRVVLYAPIAEDRYSGALAAQGRVVAVLSLAIWIAVIASGRLMPYFDRSLAG
jgi:hypothetical protein